MTRKPLSLDKKGIVHLGLLPKSGRIILHVAIADPSAESYRVRVFVDDAETSGVARKSNPRYAGTVGVYGMGAPLGSLPKHVSMSPSVKDHRVDITDIVRRVVDAEVDLRVVAERLDGTRVDPREAPIASIAVEYRP